MKRTNIAAGLALALTAIAVTPLLAGAQASDPELDRLHDHAMSLAYGSQPGAIHQAVFMHSRVVHQRTARDPGRFDCLKSHANLLYHAGYVDAARLYMEAAAEQAASERRDYDAAMAYLDAATLAQEAGDRAAVVDLAAQAAAHASSPRLRAEQRSQIFTRIGA